MSKQDIRALEAELQELRQRIEKLESLFADSKAAHGAGGSGASDSAESLGFSEEIILAISAAVAAFLGKRASIRQVHLTGETPWAMQGRATVQASHGIAFFRGHR